MIEKNINLPATFDITIDAYIVPVLCICLYIAMGKRVTFNKTLLLQSPSLEQDILVRFPAWPEPKCPTLP